MKKTSRGLKSECYQHGTESLFFPGKDIPAHLQDDTLSCQAKILGPILRDFQDIFCKDDNVDNLELHKVVTQNRYFRYISLPYYRPQNPMVSASRTEERIRAYCRAHRKEIAELLDMQDEEESTARWD